VIRPTLLLAAACFVAACDSQPARVDADVIVIGAGIAGISAALEASAEGADVIVIEWSSVPGGHAVEAGGFALVDTPLQRSKGYTDSPDLAYGELMAWGEDANAEWVRLFVDQSRTEVHDWLTGMGVKFSILLTTPEGSIPRFHFAGGTAVNAVVPMLREALSRDNILWSLNSHVETLQRAEAGTLRVTFRDTRLGATQMLDAAAVVLATGGFQGNLGLVRKYWPDDVEEPELILNGAGHFALGEGIALGTSIGAANVRLQDQVTFVNGMRNPREPERGLLVMNPASIWVDLRGRRFVDESSTTKRAEAAVFELAEQTYWMLFDSVGVRQLRIRGAEWLNRTTMVSEILDNPAVTAKADTIAELAARAGLPPDELQATVARFNDAAADPSNTKDVFQQPPFYAIQLWPMSRKSLGGLKIDVRAQAGGPDGQPVPGLFAAGELTGVAGVNGSHGGSGTFLAPSVLAGRIAGRGAAEFAAQQGMTATGFATAIDSGAVAPAPTEFDADVLAALVDRQHEGYWHFEQAHRVVLARGYACQQCHSDDWPAGAAVTRSARIAQLDSCTTCH